MRASRYSWTPLGVYVSSRGSLSVAHVADTSTSPGTVELKRFCFSILQRSNGAGGGGIGETVIGGSRDAANSNATKRGCGGGFRHLAQRKSDAAQPVVLVSMTRRPSNPSGQWKPFKWKTSDGVQQRRSSSGGGGGGLMRLDPQQLLQTNVDLSGDPTPESADDVAVARDDGRDNPAYSPDRTDV